MGFRETLGKTRGERRNSPMRIKATFANPAGIADELAAHPCAKSHVNWAAGGGFAAPFSASDENLAVTESRPARAGWLRECHQRISDSDDTALPMIYQGGSRLNCVIARRRIEPCDSSAKSAHDEEEPISRTYLRLSKGSGDKQIVFKLLERTTSVGRELPVSD